MSLEDEVLIGLLPSMNFMNSVQKHVVGKNYLENGKIMNLHEAVINLQQLLPPKMDLTKPCIFLEVGMKIIHA